MSAQHLLQEIITVHSLRNYAQLAHRLGAQPAYISKIRSGKLPVNGNFILTVYDTFGMSIERIRALVAA